MSPPFAFRLLPKQPRTPSVFNIYWVQRFSLIAVRNKGSRFACEPSIRAPSIQAPSMPSQCRLASPFDLRDIIGNTCTRTNHYTGRSSARPRISCDSVVSRSAILPHIRTHPFLPFIPFSCFYFFLRPPVAFYGESIRSRIFTVFSA